MIDKNVVSSVAKELYDWQERMTNVKRELYDW
jgi:hypothetical protein